MGLSTKRNICFVIPSDAVAKSFILSGSLVNVFKSYNLVFLVNKNVTFELPGNVIFVEPKFLTSAFLKRLDLLFWFHSLYLFMRKHNLRDEDSFKVAKLSWLARRLHEALALPFLSSIVIRFDSFFFKKDVIVLKQLLTLSLDLLILPGVAIDSYSHIFLRTANYSSIPTLMIVAHWDYFTKKGLLRTLPKKLFVWGEDMKESVLHNENINADDVKIIGVPHFEKYKKKLPPKNVAKKYLGLDVNLQWLFFPGSGLPFDELTVIKKLTDYFQSKNIKNLGIIYRPHPRAWLRETKLRTSAASLPNVFVDSSSSDSDDHFRNLMASSDGIISPYSTMILEGGMCGLPSFCLGFSDGVNTWNWSQVNNFEHLKPLRGREWVTICDKAKDLEKTFCIFLKKIQFKNKSNIKKSVLKTVYFDQSTYSRRLHERINEIIGNHENS